MDIYISSYFTNKDSFMAQEMQLFILGDNRINLENKRAIFQRIAESHDLEWFASYKSIRNVESKKGAVIMNKDLKFVIEERNKFAHLITDSSDEGLNRDGELGFVRFKDKGETFWYNQATFKELATIIINLTVYIKERNEKS